jgi:hypothetical protein
MEAIAVNGEALVHDYLGRLDAAAWPLPPGRRTELRTEVAEHIETALAEAGSRDEVTIRNVLERLGAPEEIVSVEVDPVSAGTGRAAVPAPALAPPAPGRAWGAIEILAILFLTVGAIVLPIIGPVAGLVFTWASQQWTTRQKAVATAIIVLLVAIPIVVLFAATPGSGATAQPGGLP